MLCVGKLTLNRNPDNYFTETEQVAFNVTNIVQDIGFTDDPLLQGRALFPLSGHDSLRKYLHAQLHRIADQPSGLSAFQ